MARVQWTSMSNETIVDNHSLAGLALSAKHGNNRVPLHPSNFTSVASAKLTHPSSAFFQKKSEGDSRSQSILELNPQRVAWLRNLSENG
jgi:hypothetical protein